MDYIIALVIITLFVWLGSSCVIHCNVIPKPYTKKIARTELLAFFWPIGLLFVIYIGIKIIISHCIECIRVAFPKEKE